MISADTVCYRHPDRLAAVGCQRCDRPICSSCMTQASVGFHCPECVRSSGQRVYRANDLLNKKQPVTMVLMAIIVVIFLAQMGTIPEGRSSAGSSTVASDGLLFGPSIEQLGEYWRIVTSGFLHGSLMHLAFNGYALWIFGQAVERAVGSARMLLIYAGGLLGGSAAVLAFNFATPTLGASGAVLGLAGGLAGILAAQGRSIMQTSLGTIFLINLGLPILIGGISFWGHFGGIVGGALIGAILAYVPGRMRQPQQVALGAAIAALVVLGALAAFLGATGGVTTIDF